MAGNNEMGSEAAAMASFASTASKSADDMQAALTTWANQMAADAAAQGGTWIPALNATVEAFRVEITALKTEAETKGQQITTVSAQTVNADSDMKGLMTSAAGALQQY